MKVFFHKDQVINPSFYLGFSKRHWAKYLVNCVLFLIDLLIIFQYLSQRLYFPLLSILGVSSVLGVISTFATRMRILEEDRKILVKYELLSASKRNFNAYFIWITLYLILIDLIYSFIV